MKQSPKINIQDESKSDENPRITNVFGIFRCHLYIILNQYNNKSTVETSFAQTDCETAEH